MNKFLLLLFSFCLLASFSLGQSVFVGSETCKTCHSTKYDSWKDSGHPYKFSIIENNEAPFYPDFVTNFEDSWIAELGDSSHTWADVAGVIGGFGWKARFVGTDGYIIGTAGSSFGDAGKGHNQLNFFGGEKHGWVDYDASKTTKLYNYGCFKCHTTGGDTSGTWLDGVAGLGTFNEGGIGCESCHGPGSEHVGAPSKTNIDRVYEFAHLDNGIGGLDYGDGNIIMPDAESNDVNFLCGTCHNRSYTAPINSKGGFIKHHEQWDEFITTEHFEKGFDCLTCHNPHKRVLWDGDGITKTCETCHSEQAATIKHSSGATCIDCHMPFAAKSGTTRGESGYRADVRSHLFRINPDTASMFTADLSAVKDDAEREAALSPHFACLGCHNNSSTDDIPDKTIAQASAGAKGMHTGTAISSTGAQVPENFALMQNFPNPFNPATTIRFQLPHRARVTMTVHSLTGETVAMLLNGEVPAGEQQVNFNAQNLTSGMYFYTIATEGFTQTKKMILIR